MTEDVNKTRARAAGIMHLTHDNHTLMVHRTDGRGWAFPGGRIEDGEIPEQAARREHEEETEHEHKGPLEYHTRRIDENVDFTTFIARDSESFTPVLNEEHDAFQWIDRHKAVDTLDLHPGARIALLKDDLDELSLAKAIRDGELISPQQHKNILLMALRITGTGAAFRLIEEKEGEEKQGEYTWRDPSFYLNDEFLERCQGLPVIFEHPEKDAPDSKRKNKRDGLLNGKELSDRIVGTIMLPYIVGDAEVWGIAKIYDEKAAKMLCKKQLSTSPCVVFRPESAGSKYRLQDGSMLLIEGRPALIDHLAIDEAGVWDKGGEPSGVLNQLEEKPMAEETIAPAKSDSSKAGSPLDDILSRLDSHNAEWTKRWDSMASRMDAFEKKGEEKKEEPAKEEAKPTEEGKAEETPVKEGGGKGKAEGEPEKVEEKEKPPIEVEKKEGQLEQKGESEKLASDASAEKALEEERKENGLTKNDCSTTETPMADSTKSDSTELQALRTRLAELEKRVPDDLPEGERLKFVDAQVKAQRVALAFGDSAGAPNRVAGESLNQYRRRLITNHKKHSPQWKDVDISAIDNEAALNVIEGQVYSDAMKAAKHPTDLPEGTLRVSIEEDETGRRIRRYHGDPEACWGPFKQEPKHVVGWQTKFH
jgi:8-oxo-dGTP pyrophosphatase MutT (NUDIX family)